MSTLVSLPDHYRIDETLRRETHTSTYKATDLRTGCTSVLKSVKPLDWLTPDEMLRRYESVRGAIDEVSGVQNRSVSLAELVDGDDGSLWTVRPFEFGPTLRSRIDRRRLLSLDEACWIALEAGDALDEVRQSGASHGSLTPENMVIESDGSPKILDAGFRAALRSLSIAGTSCARISRMDHRGDLSQLAASLFEGLTGSPASERAIDTARELPARTRYALHRAFASGSYLSGSEFSTALLPKSPASTFRVVWRPAAAAGLLGSLVTVGGYASSEKRDLGSKRSGNSETRIVKTISSSEAAPLPITDQDRRLVQLAFRRHGAAALADATVSEIFGLNDTQRDEIDVVLEDQRTRVTTIVALAAEGKTGDTAAQMKQLRFEMGHRILRILTDSQRLTWENANSGSTSPVPGEPTL